LSLEPDTDRDARSAETCPVCGAHRLATIDFPRLSGAPYLPASEAVGIPTSSDRPALPGIGCLACGASWPSLAAFRAAPDGAEFTEEEPPLADGALTDGEHEQED
jgi:hypothetical protein